MVPLSHLSVHTGLLGKKIALTIWTFVGKLCLCFLILYLGVIAFLLRSKHLLILWLQSLSVVILEPKKIKSVTAPTFLPFICHEVMRQGSLACCSSWGHKESDTTEWLNWTELMGPDTMILGFWMLSFKPAFSLSSSTFVKRLFSSSSLSSLEWYICISEVVDISPGHVYVCVYTHTHTHIYVYICILFVYLLMDP